MSLPSREFTGIRTLNIETKMFRARRSLGKMFSTGSDISRIRLISRY